MMSTSWDRQLPESSWTVSLEAQHIPLLIDDPSRLALLVSEKIRPILACYSFVVVRHDGVLDVDASTRLFHAIGQSLGTLMPQNAKSELMYSVTNERGHEHTAYARGAKSGLTLDFHTDAAPAWTGVTPTYTALLMISDAVSGGSNLLVSVDTAHAVMEREFAPLVPRLFDPYVFDRRAEPSCLADPLLASPVLWRSSDGLLRIRYALVYLCQGADVSGVPMKSGDLLPLFALSTVMHRHELQVEFKLNPGDMFFAHNERVVHARRAYVDDDRHRRHLLRMWIQASNEDLRVDS
jgi:hypothetical protein